MMKHKYHEHVKYPMTSDELAVLMDPWTRDTLVRYQPDTGAAGLGRDRGLGVDGFARV